MFGNHHTSNRIRKLFNGGVSNNHHFLTLQQGRSMVEILAVLSLIGLLSVVAFVGVNYGFNKTKANKIAYSVNLEAQNLMITDKTNPLALDEALPLAHNKTENGFPLSAIMQNTAPDTDTLFITVSDVPYGICQQAKTMLPAGSFGIFINDADTLDQGAVFWGSCQQDEQNELTYLFDPDEINALLAQRAFACNACGPCETCDNDNQCQPDNTLTCNAGNGICHNGTCHDCPDAQNTNNLDQDLCARCQDTLYDNGTCQKMICPDDNMGNPTITSADFCTNSCGGFYDTATQQCNNQTCPQNANAPTLTTADYCQNICSNANNVTTVYTADDNLCHQMTCPTENNPITYTSAQFCDTCPGFYTANNQACHWMTCPTAGNPTQTTENFCLTSCVNTFYSNNMCHAMACPTAGNPETPTSAEFCAGCTNSFFDAANGLCRFLDCPTLQHPTNLSAEQCALCPNSVFENGQCRALDCPVEGSSTPTNISLAECTQCNGFLVSGDNLHPDHAQGCYSCTAPGIAYRNQAGPLSNCNTACNGTRYAITSGYETATCSIMTCPQEGSDTPTYVSKDFCENTCGGFYIYDKQACYSCTAPNAPEPYWNQNGPMSSCNNCSNRYAITLAYNWATCSIMTCPAPGSTTPTYVSQDFCDNNCPNRFYSTSQQSCNNMFCQGPGVNDRSGPVSEDFCLNTCHGYYEGDQTCRNMTCPQEGSNDSTVTTEEFCTNTCHGFYTYNERRCYSCTAPGEISYWGGVDGGTTCDEACPNRHAKDSTCRIMTCPTSGSDTPTFITESYCTNTCHGFYTYNEHACYACDAPGEISYWSGVGGGTTCTQACPNRRLVGASCNPI